MIALVLRVYLPTSIAQELKMVFGQVMLYLMEDEDSKSIAGGLFLFITHYRKIRLC